MLYTFTVLEETLAFSNGQSFRQALYDAMKLYFLLPKKELFEKIENYGDEDDFVFYRAGLLVEENFKTSDLEKTFALIRIFPELFTTKYCYLEDRFSASSIFWKTVSEKIWQILDEWDDPLVSQFQYSIGEKE